VEIGRILPWLTAEKVRRVLIDREDQVMTHPKLGVSWEGFAMECAMQSYYPDISLDITI
jgi:hypothetical protein